MRRRLKETLPDRNIRELVQAAIFAERLPCQRREGTTCPCGPCSAKRVLKRLGVGANAIKELDRLRRK